MIHYLILAGVFVFTDFAVFLQFLGIAFINVFIKLCVCPYVSNRMPFLEGILLRPDFSSYGMPSGHCQIYFALVAYLRLDISMFILAVVYGCLIGHERVVENEHTVFQIVVGSILGYSLGLCVV